MNILALDPATSCGWCVWTPETDYIWGVKKYPKPRSNYAANRLDGVERFTSFYKDVDALIKQYKIQSLAVEHNIMPDRSEANSDLAFSWLTMIRIVCHNAKIEPAFKYTTGQWRSINFGDQNKVAPKHLKPPQKREWYKARSIQKCQDLGYQIYNDDEAEALLLCRAHRITLDPKLAYEAGQSTRHQEELLI